MEPKPNLVKLNEDQLNELTDYLLGSSLSINDGLSTMGLVVEQLDLSSFDDIDATMFRCDWCGWWCDSDDNCGDQCCYQCSADGADTEDEDESDILDNSDSALDDGDDA